MFIALLLRSDQNKKANRNSTRSSGGSKGGAGDACPPGGPNSFNFMQFLGNFGKIICWRPQGSSRCLLVEILDPPLRSLYLTLIRVFRNGTDRVDCSVLPSILLNRLNRQEVDIFSAVKHIRLYRPQCIVNVVSIVDHCLQKAKIV